MSYIEDKGYRHPIGHTWEEEGEQLNWRELRRKELKDMIMPIVRLTRGIVAIEEEEAKQGRKPYDHTQPLNFDLRTMRQTFSGIVEALHLTVGNNCCHCERCQNVYHLLDRRVRVGVGEIVQYEKDIHELPDIYRPPKPRQGQWVKIMQPFIGDNILREVVNPILVLPMSRVQGGRRYRP